MPERTTFQIYPEIGVSRLKSQKIHINTAELDIRGFGLVATDLVHHTKDQIS